MFAYIVRKLLYMPAILFGVIAITFVLFFMVTSPDALARMRLGPKASQLQIRQWQADPKQGFIQWTEKGESKLKSLATSDKGRSKLAKASLTEDGRAKLAELAKNTDTKEGKKAFAEYLETEEGKKKIFELLSTKEGVARFLEMIQTEAGRIELDTLDGHAPKVDADLKAGEDFEYRSWLFLFGGYVKDLITFNFGDDRKDRPVASVLWEGMGPSLALTLPAFFIAEVIALFFGLFAAMYRQTRVDNVIVVSSILLMSINAIALVLFGQKFLAADWNYFPLSGWSPGFGAMRYLLLPILLYVIISFGEHVRFNRIVMLDEVNQDYVRTARAKGLNENVILFKHVFRNTLIPLITRWVVTIPSLYLGSLVLESFFGIPGLGGLTYDAISNSDTNVVRAVVVIGSVTFMFASLLSDVLYAVVDPRIRLS